MPLFRKGNGAPLDDYSNGTRYDSHSSGKRGRGSDSGDEYGDTDYSSDTQDSVHSDPGAELDAKRDGNNRRRRLSTAAHLVAGAAAMTGADGGLMGVIGAGAAVNAMFNPKIASHRSGRGQRQTREYDSQGNLEKVNGYYVERQNGELGYYDEEATWHRVRG